jgi:hypothetical protein
MNSINLQPLLKTMSENFDILPASGGAVELLEQPDEERRFEETISDKDDTVVDSFAETVKPDFLYRPLPCIMRKENHLFRHFIDGSVQTYVLGTGIEQDRNFPIVLAQIGAAALNRADDGRMSKAISEQKLLLLLPFKLISEHTLSLINKISLECAGGTLEVVDTTARDDDLGDLSQGQDPTNRATGIAKSRMRAIERAVAKSIGETSDTNFIIDGTIRTGSFGWGQGVPKKAVAISKSFTQQPKFEVFGKGEMEMRNLPRLLSGLKYEHRTPAFFTSKGNVIFWYLRMRAQGQVDYPLMGVIKVEVPAPQPGERISPETIDLISSCLLAERTVSPYGNDVRWHAHIYPVYVTETYIKNMFYNREVFKGMIKWPKIKLT